MDLHEMNKRIETLSKLREEKDAAEAVVSEINQKIEVEKQAIVSALESAQIDSYKSPHATVSRKERVSFQTPKDWASKQALMEFIRTTDGEEAMQAMLSFNSQTINSYAKRVLETRAENLDLSTTIPGLGEPKVFIDLSVRKS